MTVLSSPVMSRWPVLVPWAAAGAGAASLAVAYFYFERHLGLPPCDLCIRQRAATAAALVAFLLVLSGRPVFRSAGLFLMTISFLAGTGIALFHAGVEQGWWTGPGGCSSSLSGLSSIAELERRLEQASLVPCDEITWSWLGLSIAGWNAVFSLFAGLACLAALMAPRPEKWQEG